MNPTKPRPKMKTKKVLQQFMSNVIFQITGVSRIIKAHDLVQAEYGLNGPRKSVKMPLAQWESLSDDPMALIRAIEEGANNAHGKAVENFMLNNHPNVI